jgi:hypothetical protein
MLRLARADPVEQILVQHFQIAGVAGEARLRVKPRQLLFVEGGGDQLAREFLRREILADGLQQFYVEIDFEVEQLRL